MAFTPEDFRSAGVLPKGPVSAWPQDRHDKMMAEARVEQQDASRVQHATEVKPGMRQMAGGLINAGRQAIFNGKVASGVREERMETCRQCPSFIEASRRCSECGCFMEAKSWIAGNPDTLCPLKKWKV